MVITLFNADSTLEVEPTIITEPEKRSTKPNLIEAAFVQISAAIIVASEGVIVKIPIAS